MHTFLDDDWYETIVESKPCPCKGKCDGHCTGSFSIYTRQRDPVEVMKIKAERRRKEEDQILIRAEEIKRSRGLS